MLHHVHFYLFALLVLKHGHHIMYSVLASRDDALHRGKSLHLEGNHNLERLVVFLHFSQPVTFLHTVAHLHDGYEVPLTICVQRFCILTSLEEDAFHLVQVILQTVIVLAQHSRAHLDFKHVACKLSHRAYLQSSGTLEHLNIGILACDLDYLGHQAVSSRLYVAYFSLHHGSVHTDGDHIGNYATYSSFCHVICFLLFISE